MLIRATEPTDYSGIQTLLECAYEPVLAAMSPGDAEKFRSGFAAAVKRYGEKGTWFVAESNNHLIGCVAYFPPHSVTHPVFNESWAHVQLLGVAGSSTRCGIGRGLMLHCMAVAHRAGVKTFGLQTSELMAPARRLYESLGFVVERVLPPAFGHPTYLYVRDET